MEYSAEIRLLLHNIGYIFSSLLTFGLALFIYTEGQKRLESVTYSAGVFCAWIFSLSHLFGVNTADPVLSRTFFLFNLVSLFSSVFIAHSVLSMLGRARAQRHILTALYIASFMLLVLYLSNTKLFLEFSAPKLYFPNYYVPGKLYFLAFVYAQVLVPIYFLYHLIHSYKTASAKLRNQIKYLLLGLLALGYGFISSTLFLTYDIALTDPLWSAFFGFFFTIPFAYGVLKHDVMDFALVGRKALIFGFAVGVVGTFLSLLSYFNNFLVSSLPDFPAWLFPFISSAVVILVSVLVWKSVREGDVLKYEFISVVTHKFRTPLTHIKWESDHILEQPTPPEIQEGVRDIKTSASRLSELTDLLLKLSEIEDYSHLYRLEYTSVGEFVESVVAQYRLVAQKKKLTLTLSVSPSAHSAGVSIDTSHTGYALQVILDNAINYTPPHGRINVTVYHRSPKNVAISIADSGIGIAPSELANMYTKFYRGESAKRTDTEGVGIGLFMAKRIIERQGGTLTVTSEGVGKGSTFTVSLPTK